MIQIFRRYAYLVLAPAGLALLQTLVAGESALGQPAAAQSQATQHGPVERTADEHAPGKPAAPATRPVVAQAQIDRWLQDLSHPSFTEREAATAGLSELPDEALPALVEAYGHLGGYEPRLRLRSAIEHLFYRKQLQGRMGFLGLQPRVESQIFDPALGRTVEVLLMSRVLPGFPAEQAGVQTGDLLLEFDGKPIGEVLGVVGPQQPLRREVNGRLQFFVPGSPQIDAFTNEVSQREPGSQVSMRLLRVRGEDRHVQIKVGKDPARALEGAGLISGGFPQMTAPIREMFGPSMRRGLFVATVTQNSPAAMAGLKTGDVIVGLAGAPFPANVTPDQFKTLLSESGATGTVVLTLSHVEQVKVMVTLGGRPVNRMNPGDMEIAQARFAEWWRRQTGESSLRDSDMGQILMPRAGRPLPDAALLP